MLLIMTVEPGFGGQAFLDIMLPKIRRTRELISRHGLELWLQVDGGVSAATIERCAEAGADVFVAGSAVYGADDPAAAVRDAARPGGGGHGRRAVGMRATDVRSGTGRIGRYAVHGSPIEAAVPPAVRGAPSVHESGRRGPRTRV